MFRSLNNLLERFHQSFFFYLLPSTDRYISIGNDFVVKYLPFFNIIMTIEFFLGFYMPCLVLLVGALFLKAFSMWIQYTSKNDDSTDLLLVKYLKNNNH